MLASSTRGATGVGFRPAARSMVRRVGEVEARIMALVDIRGLFLGPGRGEKGFGGQAVGIRRSPGLLGQRYPAVQGIVTWDGRTGRAQAGEGATCG